MLAISLVYALYGYVFFYYFYRYIYSSLCISNCLKFIYIYLLYNIITLLLTIHSSVTRLLILMFWARSFKWMIVIVILSASQLDKLASRKVMSIPIYLCVSINCL
jgi:hypothetical protein